MASASISAAPVAFTYPPSSLLKFPPDPQPTILAPPPGDGTLAHPFTIPPEIYNELLSVKYPIAIALIYATTVTIFNQLNAKRGHKPWAFSKTSAFQILVILHNVFLAIYSAWTFAGMVNAIVLSWPGWRGEDGIAGAVDALCKINGPRGLGSAATYDSSQSAWTLANRAYKLLNSEPDPTDVGRIWNSGLAFYGWLFYLSKFYEVLDTAIILAKGKKSSILQTYHHAGAMMCMWAGIRYMAPPIWMFVLVNSGIHALMYTYYTLTALGFKVPMVVKRTLTTLQIIQFIIGVPFAFAHLFIAYDIPISVPYIFSLADNLSSAIPSSVSSAVDVATATATAGLSSWLKKVALRAAGSEGPAENVRNEQNETFGVDAYHAVEDLKAREEIRYRTSSQKVHCTDTSGQAFAILVNCLYLAPLTWLFVNFFVRSYTRRSSVEGKKTSTASIIEKSGRDALKGLGRELNEAVGEMHGSDGPSQDEAPSEKASSGKPKTQNPAGSDEKKEEPKTPHSSRRGKADEGPKEVNGDKGGNKVNGDKNEGKDKPEQEKQEDKQEDKMVNGDKKEAEKAEEAEKDDADTPEKDNADTPEKKDTDKPESKDEEKREEQDAGKSEDMDEKPDEKENEKPGGKENEKPDEKENENPDQQNDEKSPPPKGDAGAYEASTDEVMNPEEKEAEKEVS